MKNFLREICEICNRDILFSNVIENSRNFDFPTKTNNDDNDVYLQKNWVCFQCGKRYLWRGSLKNHMRVECGKEPTFKCPCILLVYLTINNVHYNDQPIFLFSWEDMEMLAVQQTIRLERLTEETSPCGMR
uniref:C2H2-type domain-containing protein n=1 Tax=Vespula pensylvanica TaxID=30213 RepID=A0A834KMQ8_VESPE|nr:hypothetical protein H0235_013376 [Vespula pensylvanica]